MAAEEMGARTAPVRTCHDSGCRLLALYGLTARLLPTQQHCRQLLGILVGSQAQGSGWRGPEQMRDPGIGTPILRKKLGSQERRRREETVSAAGAGGASPRPSAAEALFLSRTGNPRQQEFRRGDDSKRVFVSIFQQRLPFSRPQLPSRSAAGFPFL